MTTVGPPEVKPQVAHLADLLKWIQQGRLRVPRFQRPFRWDRARVRDLFDSIRRQYPIGTLLMWIPGGSRPSRDTLGPLRLPPSPGGDMLLIDGQQRVCVIAGVLLQKKLEAADEIEDPGMWDLWFDAEGPSGGQSPGFCHRGAEDPASSWIRVRDLLDIRALMKATGEVQKSIQDDRRVQGIVEAWQAAATALNSYRIPIVEFHTNDLTLAVESFTRLNRRGLDIAADEMFSALAGDEARDKRLSDYIDDTLRAVRAEEFGEIERLTVLRLILLELGLDPFRADWDKLDQDRRSATKSRLEEVAVSAHKALLEALLLLRDGLSLVSVRLLPYSGIVIGVAAYLIAREKALGGQENELAPTEQRRLADWCWHAAFAGFAEGNPSRATQIWGALREAGRTPFASDPLPRISAGASPTPFPSRFDLRAARLRTSLWAAMTTWDLDATLRQEVGRFLNERREFAYRRICGSRREPVSKELKTLLSSPANRIFDVWGLSKTLSAKASAGNRGSALFAAAEAPTGRSPRALSRDEVLTLAPDVIHIFHLTQGAIERLRAGDDEGFLRLRLERMIDDDRERMSAFGLTPPEDRRPAQPAIEHSDDLGSEDGL